MPIFNTKQTVKLTGIKLSRLKYLCTSGVLNPINRGDGTGISRKFTHRNLIEILIVRALTEQQIRLDFLPNILRAIEDECPNIYDVKKSSDFKNYILTILIQSHHAIIMNLSDLQEAMDCMKQNICKGFTFIAIDLNTIREEIKNNTNHYL